MHPPPFEVICYHCQQAAEKFLKGFLAFQGEPIRKTHDLVLLNKLCAGFDEAFKKIENECLELTDFGVNIRYPFSFEVNESDVIGAINNAQRIEDYVIQACL